MLSFGVAVTYWEEPQAAGANRLFPIFATRVSRPLRVHVHWKGEAVSAYRRSNSSSRCSSSLRELKSLGVSTFTLDNGEVNLNLIEPTGMDGGL